MDRLFPSGANVRTTNGNSKAPLKVPVDGTILFAVIVFDRDKTMDGWLSSPLKVKVKVIIGSP